MADHIRRIIMGSDLVPQAEVKREAKTGEQSGYPIIPPDGASGAYRAALMLFLGTFVKRHQLGRVFGDEVSFNLEQANPSGIMAPVAPEISFVSFERLPADAYEDVTLNFPPDLWVEGAPVDAIPRKAAYYLGRGVPLVWLVDPVGLELYVCSAGNPAGKVLTLDDDLRGEGLLAAFNVPMRAVFGEDEGLQVEILGRLIRG